MGRARERRGKGRKQAVSRRAQAPRRPLLGGWRIFAVAAGVILLAGGALWWARDWRLPPLDGVNAALAFPLRQVRVAGSFHHVSAAQVRDIVAPYAARGFFAADVAAIRAALRALPWVAQAAVRRVWPDRLQIVITEQRAVARWGREGLLNEHGEIFVPAGGDLPGGLPRLQGPPGSAAEMLARCRAMAASLAPLGLRVSRLTLDRRRSWQAVLDNGVQLALGKAQPVRRVARFARYYPRVVAGREGDAEIFDLRYANGFVVRWRTRVPQPGGFPS